MALLIDGYNLLHVTGIFGKGVGPGSLHRSRQALLNFLAASIDPNELPHAAIVFDAADAPPGLPDTLDHQGLTVHYARGYPDADSMLEELIANHPAARSLTVVSADHRVQRAARRRKSTAIDSDRWYAELLTKRRAGGDQAATANAKPEGELDPAEVAYWLEQFSDPPDDLSASRRTREREAEVENPFPPGYGEDLLDE